MDFLGEGPLVVEVVGVVIVEGHYVLDVLFDLPLMFFVFLVVAPQVLIDGH